MNTNLNTNRFGSATVTLPSDTDIRIVRRFDAPASLVFECWTTPEHIQHWWGWETSTFVVCENDLRVGGTWRYVGHDEHGKEFGWHGTNLEIDAPHRLVATEVFEGFPDGQSMNTMTLTEENGVTTNSEAQTDSVIVNAMSIDVEDYFHVSVFDGIVPRSEWDRMESRVCANTDRLLDIFGECEHGSQIGRDVSLTARPRPSPTDGGGASRH